VTKAYSRRHKHLDVDYVPIELLREQLGAY